MEGMNANELLEFLQDLENNGTSLKDLSVYCLCEDDVIRIASVADFDGESVNIY